MPQRNLVVALYWLLTLAAASRRRGRCMVAFYTPTEATMGPIQKIFYLHLPVAINTFLACLVVFVASHRLPLAAQGVVG